MFMHQLTNVSFSSWYWENRIGEVLGCPSRTTSELQPLCDWSTENGTNLNIPHALVERTLVIRIRVAATFYFYVHLMHSCRPPIRKIVILNRVYASIYLGILVVYQKWRNQTRPRGSYPGRLGPSSGNIPFLPEESFFPHLHQINSTDNPLYASNDLEHYLINRKPSFKTSSPLPSIFLILPWFVPWQICRQHRTWWLPQHYILIQ